MVDDFWLGVIITLIVGIPVAYGIAILANMHTPRLVQFLDRRNLLKTHKTRKQALRVFCRIRDFREGTRDRYAHYIILASSAIVCAVAASMLVLIVVFQNEFPIAISFGILVLI